MKRTLSLKREHLTELTAGELRSVAGGAPPTVPVRDCLLDSFSCFYSCGNTCWCAGEVE